MLLTVESKEKAVEFLSPDAPVGTKITVEGERSNPKQAIDFKEFSKIKMEAREGKVFYNGKTLFAGKQPLETKKVKEGKIC